MDFILRLIRKDPAIRSSDFPQIGWRVDKKQKYSPSKIKNDMLSLTEHEGSVDVYYVLSYKRRSKMKFVVVRIQHKCLIKTFTEKPVHYTINLYYQYYRQDHAAKMIEVNDALVIEYVPFETFKEWSRQRIPGLNTGKIIKFQSCENQAMKYQYRIITKMSEHTKQEPERAYFTLGGECNRVLTQIFNRIHWNEDWKQNLERLFREYNEEWLKTHDSIDYGCQAFDDVSLNEFRTKANTVNILLLGPAGVGKTTLVNNIANCLNKNSLDEALKEPLTVAPNQFWMQDKSKKVCMVTINKEGATTADQAIEKGTRIYEIPNSSVHVIDTEPIVEMDRPEGNVRNGEEVQKFVKQMNEHVLVCVVLKCNESKVHAELVQTMKEITTCFPPAQHVYMFCFTNSRTTHYKAGDSVPTMKEVMKKLNIHLDIDDETMFFIDSEYYRYIATNELNLAKYKNKHEKGFNESFINSKNEITRLIQFATRKQRDFMAKKIKETQ